MAKPWLPLALMCIRASDLIKSSGSPEVARSLYGPEIAEFSVLHCAFVSGPMSFLPYHQK